MPGSFARLYYHLVFSTKHRKPFIQPGIEDRIHQYAVGIFRNIGGDAIEINGMADHVHVLAVVPPRVAVSEALRTVKANSSRWVHETFADLSDFGWQDGYGAFTVSKSLVDAVRQYIRDQKAHHQGMTFEREFVGLLDRHEVEYDSRYLWD
jgi:REP element-mobilizing transposase RayT